MGCTSLRTLNLLGNLLTRSPEQGRTPRSHKLPADPPTPTPTDTPERYRGNTLYTGSLYRALLALLWPVWLWAVYREPRARLSHATARPLLVMGSMVPTV